MIVSSLVGNPISVLISDNVYAETVADLKALSVTNLPNSTQISVGGYYNIGDGGGGTFFYKSTSSTTDNGGTVIAPDVGAGRWIRILPSAGLLSVKWFGAKGDGTTDDTAAISAAIAASGTRCLFFPAGYYRITSALNLTNKFGPFAIRGEGWTLDGTGSIIYAETSGSCAIDCTGSSYIDISDLSVVAFGRPNPASVGILYSRSTTSGYEYSQFNTLRRVLVRMTADISLNGGKGSVAVYNKAAEQNHYTDVHLRADNPLVFTGTNTFGITSPYATINDSITSCGLLTVDGSSSDLTARNDTTACALLSGAYAVTFNNTYFQGTGFGGANNRAIVAKGSSKIYVSGNMELLNSVIYLEDCNDVTLNMCCVATGYAPIEIGVGKFVNKLIFSPYVVTGPYTNWPRFINAGTGATHNDTHINVPGDDGSVSGTNCTDFRGYFRSIKASATGQGGFNNMHLPGNPVIEQALTFTSIAASARPNGSLFLDSADGVLKFKDSGGTVHALW